MATQSSATATPFGTGFSPLRGEPTMGGIPQPTTTVTTVVAGTTKTITAAQMLGGLVLHDPTGASNDTLDTANNLVAAMPGAAVGQSFYWDLVNIADASEIITVVAGTGGTLFTYSPASGTYTLAQNTGRRFLVQLTNVDIKGGTAAYTVYSLGAFTF